MKVKRSEIFLANFDPVIGSEQGRVRPALIIQNDLGNENSPITIVAPITSREFSKDFPTNVRVLAKESGLNVDSTVLLNQIRSIDKKRIIKRLGSLDSRTMLKVNSAIKESLSLE